MESFDFIVIGAGSGGMAAARRAAHHGARVILLEARRVGGTCVNLGCVPKKLMFNASSVAEALQDASSYGFRVERGKFDWAGFKRRRDAFIERLDGIYRSNLEREGVELVSGRARLVSPSQVDVDGRLLTAPHVLVATGSYPRVPDLPGAQLGITSNGFFELEEMPRQVAVVGAGYIGIELVGIFNALGAKVSLFSRYCDVLPEFDGLIRERLLEQLLESGVTVLQESEPRRVGRTEGGLLRLTVRDGREVDGFDALVWAVGRLPATDGIGLDKVGVRTSDLGHIVVDDRQNTNVRGVYAVGDVTGRLQLTPLAIAAGRHLADRLFGGQPDARLEDDQVPSVVFGHPPIATVGLTEAQARERFGEGDVKVYTRSFTNIYHAVTERKPKTSMKLVTRGSDELVVGIHVIGMGADELIQGFAVAMRCGATKRDLDRTIAVHPTAAEELVTLR